MSKWHEQDMEIEKLKRRVEYLTIQLSMADDRVDNLSDNLNMLKVKEKARDQALRQYSEAVKDLLS